MSADQNRVSVTTQGIVFDQQVVYEGQQYLADNTVTGAYHAFGEIDGHQLLTYCRRCNDARSDGCLGNQLMLVDFYNLHSEHFVNRSR